MKRMMVRQNQPKAKKDKLPNKLIRSTNFKVLFYQLT